MAKILYAEDDEDISEMMVLWLQRKSHAVQLVETGLQALECLEFERYDLLLLDGNMPDCDGVSVLKAFREKDKKTPVIILTGSSGVASREYMINAGATEVFFKPPKPRHDCCSHRGAC